MARRVIADKLVAFAAKPTRPHAIVIEDHDSVAVSASFGLRLKDLAFWHCHGWIEANPEQLFRRYSRARLVIDENAAFAWS